MDTQENAQAIVDLLNELIAADPVAAQAVYFRGVPCNKAVADHPRFIVNPITSGRTPRSEIRILGILNGLFSDARRIAAVVDDETGKLERFSVIDLRKV